MGELVPFRGNSFAQALQRAVAAAPRSLRSAGMLPPWLVKHLVMKPLTLQPRGSMAWIRDNDQACIDAFFGSREAL